MMEQASAQPTKRFFLEMLTRDISLEDAILDLVDNSIDSLSRSRNLDLSSNLLKIEDQPDKILTNVQISVAPDEFRITDTCGGIGYESAKSDVFRFGRVIHPEQASLSVYGIGLKRAIFKIGQDITVESRTTDSGFKVRINVPEWSKEDSPWTFPLEKIDATKRLDDAGTTITIRKLNPEIVMRINDGTLESSLRDLIATTYPLFLGRFVTVDLNGGRIEPQKLPLGESAEVTPAYHTFDEGDVQITIIASLAERIDGKWNTDRAGWYVLCNGRIVVSANKTELTDWGVKLPQFVSKYRGFLGIAFFSSKNPETLPWTTTKRA